MDKNTLAAGYHDIFHVVISWKCETSEFRLFLNFDSYNANVC